MKVSQINEIVQELLLPSEEIRLLENPVEEIISTEEDFMIIKLFNGEKFRITITPEE